MATARFIAGLVTRKIATATGSETRATDRWTPRSAAAWSIGGSEASEDWVLSATACAGATAFANAARRTRPAKTATG